MKKTQKLVVAITILMFSLLFLSSAKAQTVQMTASVPLTEENALATALLKPRWDNCRVQDENILHPRPTLFYGTPTGFHSLLEDGSVIDYTDHGTYMWIQWEDAWGIVDATGVTWGECVI